jgi:DNA-binding beta-propeller fold protein YncE
MRILVMIRHHTMLFAAVLGITSAVSTMPHALAQSRGTELKVIDTFKIGGAGRWDYPVLDQDGKRLYIARDNHVQVIDAKIGAVLGDLTGVEGAHGIATVLDRSLGFITSGRENAVAVFDPQVLKVTRKINTPDSGGRNPDPILYDQASRKVFAFCAGGDAVVIDPADLDAPLVSIPCGGKLEYARADGSGRIFANNEESSEIVVIDSMAMRVTARWPIAPAAAPTGLAIDLAHHRLFSVGDNQKMAIVDYDNGQLIGTVAIGRGVDGCAFDPTLGVALSANGRDGTVTVVGETMPGKFAAIQTLATLKSGRTIVGDPATSRFFIPAMIPAEGAISAQFGVVVVGPVK